MRRFDILVTKEIVTRKRSLKRCLKTSFLKHTKLKVNKMAMSS